MKNQEYLNIITNEIKKNEELLKNVNNLITFHTNVEGENSNKIHELLKNRDLYYTRIEMLKGIEKLPLYTSVLNMEDEELNKIREDLINNEKKKLNIVDKKIKELENNIINADNEIGKIYELYKTNNDETYIERAKEILLNVKIYKKELEKLKEEKKEIKNNIKNKIDLKDNEIKEIVLNDLGVPNSIEDNLNKYKPNKIDKLVVPMCDNLEILDNIISNMEKYNELKDKKTNKSILIPHILESYKFNSYEESTLEWFLRDLYDSKNVNNELIVYDEEDYDILSDKIEEGLEFVERDKKSLEIYKDILNLFPENILDWDLFELKTLTDKMFGYTDFTIKTLLERIEELNNEYIELCHKRYQTIKVVEKEELLKFKIRDLVNETLNILWKNIIYKINTTIEYIEHGFNICDSVDFSKIDNQNNNIIILQNKYDTLNLINAKILIEQIINKYNDIIDALYKKGMINMETLLKIKKKYGEV